MAIFNLGSINADYFYRVPHLPAPGETLPAKSMTKGLGGKGANMSVAAARAGATVQHIGAVGLDGQWAVDQMARDGIDMSLVSLINEPTAHALIYVDDAGENSIVIFSGANAALSEEMIDLGNMTKNDILVMQNETNQQRFCAELGSKIGARVAYAAAPFDTKAVQDVLPFVDLLVLNEVEAAQLAEATGKGPEALGVSDVIVTLGANGARWIGAADVQEFSSPKVTPVDTTGAGDTFTGYLLAGLDAGMDMASAITRATKAGAIMVTRHGTADVIPTAAEVSAF